jgi:hypothetical protein
MKKIALSILLMFFFTATLLQGQSDKNLKQRYYKIAVSNSHSAKPFGSFSSLFYKDFHPGLDIGYESLLQNKNKHQWFLEMRLSYMFHRWVQHNIALSIDAGYRYAVTSSWSAEIKLGAGYQLSIPDSKVFTITESDGVKKKKNFGRSQVIGNLGFAVSKDLAPPFGTRIFMEYQQRIQAPFIKEYVPVLPYNNLLIGVAVPMH